MNEAFKKLLDVAKGAPEAHKASISSMLAMVADAHMVTSEALVRKSEEIPHNQAAFAAAAFGHLLVSRSLGATVVEIMGIDISSPVSN